MMLMLSDALVNRIRAHGAQTYPYECCGALLGNDSAAGREISELFPLVNRREDSSRNRFSISADDFRAAERDAQERSLELVGWYHSHPDHPARPSEYDREHAWPWYSYVIVSVAAREPGEITSWRLRDDRSSFEVEEMEIHQRAASLR